MFIEAPTESSTCRSRGPNGELGVVPRDLGSFPAGSCEGSSRREAAGRESADKPHDFFEPWPEGKTHTRLKKCRECVLLHRVLFR